MTKTLALFMVALTILVAAALHKALHEMGEREKRAAALEASFDWADYESRKQELHFEITDGAGHNGVWSGCCAESGDFR